LFPLLFSLSSLAMNRTSALLATHCEGFPDARAASRLSRRLLAWYDRHGRELPWRRRRGARQDPYLVWLSEIMLQQTTVATVAGRFSAFVGRWPDFQALAEASLDEVLSAWAGLGYYARARNLHRCARLVVERHGGRLPQDIEALRALPGIGTYTAGAITAIAFDRQVAAVDGNVERVLARLIALDAPKAEAKRRLRAIAESLAPRARPGDFAQALMDLGATVCKPRSPICGQCPWREDCAAHRMGETAAFPRAKRKATRPVRHGIAFWITNDRGQIALRRRAPQGLLGGMLEAPGTPWRTAIWTEEEALAHAPIATDWLWLDGAVRHVFTHFTLELRIALGRTRKSRIPGATWHRAEDFGALALPTLMRKLAKAAGTAAG
jgi:A/G-specific adenine glycosylase